VTSGTCRGNLLVPPPLPALLHRLMEARDEKRLLKLQRDLAEVKLLIPALGKSPPDSIDKFFTTDMKKGPIRALFMSVHPNATGLLLFRHAGPEPLRR
jgi:hypothetical protein